jgi:hypothetical protein
MTIKTTNATTMTDLILPESFAATVLFEHEGHYLAFYFES